MRIRHAFSGGMFLNAFVKGFINEFREKMASIFTNAYVPRVIVHGNQLVQRISYKVDIDRLRSVEIIEVNEIHVPLVESRHRAIVDLINNFLLSSSVQKKRDRTN